MSLDQTSGVALFTDGSSWHVDSSGGWAWVAIDAFDGIESASGFVAGTTNNRMEMEAWIQGLKALYKKLGPCDVLVYCDSQLVGKGYTGEYAVKKNLDLWEKLFGIARIHESVEWIWIKGHSESKYNELADELAGKARRKGK